MQVMKACKVMVYSTP